MKKVNPLTLSTKHLNQKTEYTVLKLTILMRLVTGQRIYYTNSKGMYSKGMYSKPYVLPIFLFY